MAFGRSGRGATEAGVESSRREFESARYYERRTCSHDGAVSGEFSLEHGFLEVACVCVYTREVASGWKNNIICRGACASGAILCVAMFCGEGFVCYDNACVARFAGSHKLLRNGDVICSCFLVTYTQNSE